MDIINLLSSNDALIAWIGFIGTIIGTIIGGILSYFVAVKSVSKQMNIEEQRNSLTEQKIKKYLDNYLDYALLPLFFIMPGPNLNAHLKKEKIQNELNLFKVVLKEINNIPIELIPENIILQLSNIKILFQILEVEIENILQSSEDPVQLREGLNSIEVKKRTLKIIEYYSEISDEKGKWLDLKKDIEERYKNYQARQ